MDEDYNMVYGIDKLAELLTERGIEFCVNDEVSLVFKDDVGNLHECWKAGADENRVNALIVVTPEQLLSVPDLNGIIAENAKLKAQVEALKDYAHALELCLGESQLCEYCPSNGIDFEHDDIHCTVDFDGLRKKAGMKQ